MVDEPNTNRSLSDIDASLQASIDAMNRQIDANSHGLNNREALQQPENGRNAGASEAPSTGGNTPAGGENPSNGGGEEPTGENNGANPQQDVFDGVSHAYAGLAKPLPNKKTQPQSGSSWPKPGKKPDTKVKAPSGNTLHEMLWNELLTFYEWVIDKSVDLVLDFATFVIFPQPGAPVETAAETNDIFALGNLQFEKWQKNLLKNKEETVAIHDEIMKNLERKKINAPLVWEHLSEQPAFFDNLYVMYAEAERNPQSEAAKKMKQFKEFPKFADKMFKNSEKVGRLAYNYATLQEYTNPVKQKNIAKHIDEQAKSGYEVIMTNINKIRAAYENNPEEMKNAINRYMLGISDAIQSAHENIQPFYDKDKKIKKSDKASINEKLEAVNAAINDFMLVDANGNQSRISEIPAPQNGNIRIPTIIAPEGASEEVQQTRRQVGVAEMEDLLQRFSMRGVRGAQRA